jgi:hypothetical protein
MDLELGLDVPGTPSNLSLGAVQLCRRFYPYLTKLFICKVTFIKIIIFHGIGLVYFFLSDWRLVKNDSAS